MADYAFANPAHMKQGIISILGHVAPVDPSWIASLALAMTLEGAASVIARSNATKQSSTQGIIAPNRRPITLHQSPYMALPPHSTIAASTNPAGSSQNSRMTLK
jgi:hypothetical protein